ncbi:MAG: MFS transporter [Chloroflexi bacterium]|nr:MFS transporter [Chloroflexota bacterium]MCI0577844.1 MFS transporter [Chloroflexota bacterium]MCI0646141.1 MFS transporter [Chloroflexota bacterium]MCI0729849.1 MFS transporter [Chloroflexota bacterium]
MVNSTPSLIRPKAFYFLFFAAAASLIPFLSLYYHSLGLSGQQIGVLTGVAPLITLAGAPLWGGLADATRKHRLVLLLALAGTWAAVLALSRSTTFAVLLPVVVIHAFFASPIIPLVDNGVVTTLSGRKAGYGRLRLWGGVGWGATAALLGTVLQRAGLQWTFYSFLFFWFITLLVAWRLPVSPGTAHHPYWAGLRKLLANPRFLLLLAIALVNSVSLSIFLNYLFLHLEAQNASRTLMALSLTASTLSELPVWFIADRLLRRWGADRLLALALLATAVRAFAYAFMPAPWLVLPINLLHGLSFAAMWSAGVAYANSAAPPGLGATAQGVFAGATVGLGSALGAFAGGLVYDSAGPVVLFQATGSLLLVVFLLFVCIPGLARQGRYKASAPRTSE